MSLGLVWFRHDLRLLDNPALIQACARHQQLILLYIYEASSSVQGSAQKWWLHHSLEALNADLKIKGLSLTLRSGEANFIIAALLQHHPISAVYWNQSTTPQAQKREQSLQAEIEAKGVDVHTFQANLFHCPSEIKNQSGQFFKVFTPYWRHCRSRLKPRLPEEVKRWPKGVDIQSEALSRWQLLPKPNWASQFSARWMPGEKGALALLQDFIEHQLTDYKTNRDLPALGATSHLSPHLHFGEISPWQILSAVEQAKLAPKCDEQSAETFLSELGWREFSAYLLYYFPALPKQNFKSEFDAFPWRDDKAALKHWQQGQTGYPIVDAGMRELWATGYMHNRVRMITASFLTKHLLIDWRLGAAWFLDTLVDADEANNSASWQWVAGCGADAAPYFRIFNPVLQSQKFDAEGHYLRRWLPELAHLPAKAIHAPWQSAEGKAVYEAKRYPTPMIAHAKARERALACYKGLKAGS